METKTDRASWLKGPAFQCNPELEPTSNRPWRLVLLGPPGVGKGTIAEWLIKELGACHLSTGDVFRAAKCLPDAERSPAMTEALDYMRRGELVPDATVLEMVKERVGCLRCQGGFLLDGFPRTVAQAEALQDLLVSEKLKLDAVLNFELSIPEIVARLSDRRTCSKCKAICNLSFSPPKVEGKCDQCGGDLFQRDDDRPEAIKVRMEVYEKSTAPLISFYKKAGLLIPISCSQGSKVAFRDAMAILKKLGQPG